jgi:sec-independent protein translocase protein TatB
MFEVGPSELLVIFVLALMVLGPERLPRAARMAGLWVRRLRAQWYSVRADLERELDQEDLRRSVGEPLAELQQSLASEAEAMRRQIEAPSSHLAGEAEAMRQQMNAPSSHAAPPPPDEASP